MSKFAVCNVLTELKYRSEITEMEEKNRDIRGCTQYVDCDSRVVMMCGVSGSGKTYYAAGLEAEGYVRLSPDAILWRRYGSALSSFSQERQRRLFAEVSAGLPGRVLELLDAGERVVVDSTMCRRAKRDAMREACRSRDVEPLLVYMKASLPLLRQRLSLREGLGPDDQIVSETLLEMYYYNFEAPAADEDFIEVRQG